MRTAIFTSVIAFALLAAAQENSVAGAKPYPWTAANIKWQEEYSDGTKYSVLEGSRDIPGKAFTYASFIPAGYYEHHWHSSDARVAVLSGALRVGYGESLDKGGMQTYSVGSFLLVPANMKHSMGAETDTIIIGTALGPWSTHHNHEHRDHQH
jgi:quercetin dioxygenase-like cupin family protein